MTVKTLRLALLGIHCPGCVSGIENRLTQMGIQSMNFDYAKNEAEVSFDETVLTDEDIVSAIERLGYHAIIQENEEHGTFPL